MDIEDDSQWHTLCLDILCQILSYLQPTEIHRFSLVSKNYYEATRSEALYEVLCLVHKGIGFKPPDFTWKQLFSTDTSSVCSHLSRIKYENLTTMISYLETLFNPATPLKCFGEDCEHEKERLWACMECLHAGCGRRVKGHALQHYAETGHMLSIKLQTLEPSCYVCEQWLGEEGRHPVERARVQEIQRWLHNSVPSAMRGHLDPEMKKRRALERAMKWPEETDEMYAVIPLDWFNTWLAFIVGDSDEPTQPINNLEVFHLDPPSTIGDCAFISVEQWDGLCQVYGGGPKILYNQNTGRWVIDKPPLVINKQTKLY